MFLVSRSLPVWCRTRRSGFALEEMDWTRFRLFCGTRYRRFVAAGKKAKQPELIARRIQRRSRTASFWVAGFRVATNPEKDPSQFGMLTLDMQSRQLGKRFLLPTGACVKEDDFVSQWSGF